MDERPRLSKHSYKISIESRKSNISSCRSLERPSWCEREKSLSKNHSLVEFVFGYSALWVCKAEESLISTNVSLKRTMDRSSVDNQWVPAVKDTTTPRITKKTTTKITITILSNLLRDWISGSPRKHRPTLNMHVDVILNVNGKNVSALRLRIRSAFVGFAVLVVLRWSSRWCLKHSKLLNLPSKLSFVLAKRPNAIKNIALALRQDSTVDPNAFVRVASTVPGSRSRCRWNQIERRSTYRTLRKWKCRKVWTSSLYNSVFPTLERIFISIIITHSCWLSWIIITFDI